MPVQTSTQFESVKRRPKLLEVFWLERSEKDVPKSDRWLGQRELQVLEGLRFPKRRADWRLGRWTAKCAVNALLHSPSDSASSRSLEIQAADDGAPEIYIHGVREDLAISLSHRGGHAMCALSWNDVEIGCDLELMERRSAGFVSEFLTPDEQEFLNGTEPTQQSLLANLLWSAKESALKAGRIGLRASTLSVEVSLLEDAFETDPNRLRPWHRLALLESNGSKLHGWWQAEGEILRTVVCRLPFPAPSRLQ